MRPASAGATIGRLASRWFVRLRADVPSSGTEAAFGRWLDSNPRCEQEFQRRERLWDLASGLEHDPEIAELTAAAVASIRRRQARIRTWRWDVAATASAAIGILVALGYWLGYWPQPPLSAPESFFATAVGEQKRLALEDGSRVVLNTATRLRVQFTESSRRVRLEQGEATFSVRRDARRPFEVVSGSTMARALGTQFNVLYLDDRVEVSVLEGRVGVEPLAAASRAGAVVLHAGEAVRSTRAHGLASVERANLARIVAWQAQRIEFDDVSLAEAVGEYNRYNDTQIVVTDPATAGLRVSGVFRIGDMAGFTSALHRAFGIRHTMQEERLLLLPAEPK